MTSTTKPPRRKRSRARADSNLMETLGFSDSGHAWSDTPPTPPKPRYTPPIVPPQPVKRGRHEAPPNDAEPEPEIAWDTGEVETRLTGGDIRWVRGLAITLIILGIGIAGYWAYLQLRAEGSVAGRSAVQSIAVDLDSALADLQGTVALADVEQPLTEINTLARELFSAAGQLGAGDEALGEAATGASAAVLEATRALEETTFLQRAISVLAAPPLIETDPEALPLEEAIQRFGDWQSGLSTASLRPGLEELSPVVAEFDGLVADLDGYLSDYAAAFTDDSVEGTTAVVAEINDRLEELRSVSEASTEAALTKAHTLVDEARAKLASILG